MKQFITDRYEKTLTYLSFGYFLVFFLIQWIFHKYLNSNIIPPLWWKISSIILSIIWLLSVPIFGIAVIIRGKKIMKTKEYQEILLKNNVIPEKKLTKEEEKKKYGL